MTPAALDELLADFRRWLTQPVPAPEPPPEPAVDWTLLVNQWTALRHEINLQTRASRGMLEALQTPSAPAAPRPAEPASDDERLRPLLKTLIDVHDSLALALREVEKLQSPVVSAAEPTPPSLWQRWFGGAVSEPTTDPGASKIDALLVGYQMSLQRIERSLQQHGLEAIACVGEPFDPELMEAVEVVRDASRTRSEVLDEVRRGYRWRGRVFRFAQVRVARP